MEFLFSRGWGFSAFRVFSQSARINRNFSPVKGDGRVAGIQNPEAV